MSVGLYVMFTCLFALASNLESLTTAPKPLINTPIPLMLQRCPLICRLLKPFRAFFFLFCFILFSGDILFSSHSPHSSMGLISLLFHDSLMPPFLGAPFNRLVTLGWGTP